MQGHLSAIGKASWSADIFTDACRGILNEVTSKRRFMKVEVVN